MKRMQRVFGDYDSLRYVDGWLDDDRRSAFQRHLATDPAEAERVATWARQNEAIRAAFASVALEPVPPALRLGPMPQPVRIGGVQTAANLHVLPANPASRSRQQALPDRSRDLAPTGIRHRIAIGLATLAVAAAVVLLAIRALIQGVGLPREGDAAPPAMTRAADAHQTYAAEPFPQAANVAADVVSVAAALRRRSGLIVRAPDLTGLGWTLRSSRLVPGVDGPAGFLVYSDDTDERLGLFMGRGRGTAPAGMSTALGPNGDQGAALSWERGAVSYVITTGRTLDWLSRHGQQLRTQVDRSDP